jgi:DNA helicase HerA-like ATPase
MDVPVCVDLRRFVERSNGIFGKSGTGKSFLTRLALAGVIQTGVAVNLVFDMHSEYGWDSKTEEGTFVKGLRQLFGTRVVVYTLDPDSARRRSVSPDGVVTIGLDEIEVEDIALLQDELQLNPTAVEEANLCVDRFGREWIANLLSVEGNEGIKELAETIGGHPQALAALRRKLLDLQRLPFVQEKADRSVVDELVGHLETGRHVVLEFGQHRRLLPYILVANILTRRIHRLWVEKTERYLRSKDEADRPRHLIITVEEAHRFLNPRVSRQTTFGTIARELRKFNVTLLVVDQRPSGIDPEVLSQLGTRISAQLNDEDDIRALLTGMPNADRLRTVLASLESRQQALVLGHAVPMPVVVRTRTYDDAFYREVALPGTHVPAGRVRTYADIEREIYGDP